jgi:hypothetical protein
MLMNTYALSSDKVISTFFTVYKTKGVSPDFYTCLQAPLFVIHLFHDYNKACLVSHCEV